MAPSTDSSPDGWATDPQDTREQTCVYTVSPVFGLRHALRVARCPDPTSVTVTRTYEVTIEWTSRHGLADWLRDVAATLTPYARDRFDGDAATPAERSGASDSIDTHVPRGRGDGDGRFLAAPVDATIRPPGDADPILSDPYQYWNAPLARVQRDDLYPEGVTSLSLALVDGPNALWTRRSTAGIPPDALEGREDGASYNRVGVELTGRERFRRTPERGDRGRTAPSAASETQSGWEPAGERSAPTTDGLAAVTEATLAPAVREYAARTRSADDPVASALEAVRTQVGAVWTAFRRSDAGGDPYTLPERAVRAATTRPRVNG